MSKSTSFTVLDSMSQIAESYDALIVDLWGVIHDGQQLYPDVLNCLEELRNAGKRIIFLSNAPRRASVAKDALTRMGIGAHLYDDLLTSGEIAYRTLAHPETGSFKPRGKHYIYIGLERDRAILDGLHYEEVSHPEHAQFVLLNHYQYDHQPLQELMPLLQQCVENQLPLLCINPDKEVVRISGERVHCAGEIAHEYRMMGGHVTLIGKPVQIVYEECTKVFETISKQRMVAVGDNLHTDIAGAHHFGIKNLLITGGVLKDLFREKNININTLYEDLFLKEDVTPSYVMPSFAW